MSSSQSTAFKKLDLKTISIIIYILLTFNINIPVFSFFFRVRHIQRQTGHDPRTVLFKRIYA